MMSTATGLLCSHLLTYLPPDTYSLRCEKYGHLVSDFSLQLNVSLLAMRHGSSEWLHSL